MLTQSIFLKYKILLICIPLIICCGCAGRNTTVIETPTPTPGIDVTPVESHRLETWLHPQNCEMPCWEGIKPSESTMAEVLPVLEEIPYITTYDNSTITNFLYTNWEAQRDSGGIWYQLNDEGLRFGVRPTPDRYVVKTVNIFLGTSVSLGAIIEILGPPSYLQFHERTDYFEGSDVITETPLDTPPNTTPFVPKQIYAVNFYYLESGMVFYSEEYDHSFLETQRIDPNLLIATIQYTAPVNSLSELWVCGLNKYAKWEGFQATSVYFAKASQYEDSVPSTVCN